MKHSNPNSQMTIFSFATSQSRVPGMKRRPPIKLYCPHCRYPMQRCDSTDDCEPLPIQWLSLKCKGCYFEVFTASIDKGYEPLSIAAISMGAKRYMCYTEHHRSEGMPF